MRLLIEGPQASAQIRLNNLRTKVSTERLAPVKRGLKHDQPKYTLQGAAGNEGAGGGQNARLQSGRYF